MVAQSRLVRREFGQWRRIKGSEENKKWKEWLVFLTDKRVVEKGVSQFH